MEKTQFNFQEIWNSITGSSDDRELKERDYVYASELGQAMIDRYLKMKAVPYTNPPNDRSYRKFYAGNKWEEDVADILRKSGVKFTQQDRVSVEYPGLLRVSGKIDFVIVDFQDWPTDYADVSPKTEKIIGTIYSTFKDKVLEKTILEIKSVGGQVMQKLIKDDNPRTHHMLQAGIYHKATGISTDIVYVSRDDALLLQYKIDSIFPELEKLIIKDLTEITRYFNNNIVPPKEKLIIFEDGKFKYNWMVSYSNYLTKLYGYQTQKEYEDWAKSTAGKWNRAVKKLLSGKKLKDEQVVYLKEMGEAGYNLEEIKTSMSPEEEAEEITDSLS